MQPGSLVVVCSFSYNNMCTCKYQCVRLYQYCVQCNLKIEADHHCNKLAGLT